jgi:hypothetical protein
LGFSDSLLVIAKQPSILFVKPYFYFFRVYLILITMIWKPKTKKKKKLLNKNQLFGNYKDFQG